MKKIISFFIILGSVASACAQIQRGNVMVGGTISDFRLGLNDGGAFNASIDPKAAWFIKNGLAVGAYLNVGITAAKGTSPSSSYGIGALSRYYVTDASLNLLKKTRFFAEATAGIEGYNPGEGDNTNGLGLSVGPGIAYFITPNIGLEALVKYRGIVGFGSAATSSNLMLGIGFQIYLSRARIESEIKDVNK